MNAASAYIHYHIESFDGSSRYGEEVPDYKWLNITEAKNKMMQTFKDISLQKLQYYNPQAGIDGKDLDNFLEELGGKNGQVGSNLLSILQNTNWLFDSNGANKMPTGAGFKNESESDEDPHIPDYAANVLREVNTRIQAIINIMSQCGEAAIVCQLQSVLNGGSVDPKVLDKLNGYRFSKASLNFANEKVTSAMEVLQENLAALNSLSQGNGYSDGDKLYGSLISSIRGCFNNIGGSLFEVACVHAVRQSKYYVSQNIIPEINQMFADSGARILSVEHTGDERINGHEVKNDIEMIYYLNGIRFIVGGSLKLNNQVQQHLGNNITIKNVQGGMDFGKFLEYGKIEDNNRKWLEAYMGVFKKKNSNGKDTKYIMPSALEKNFENMKEYGKYMAALHALTGSGDFLQHDFSDIMVINNKVISMYDLLKLLANNFDSYAKFRGFPATISAYRSYVSRIVLKGAEKGPQARSWRSKETIQIINRMYARKVQMTLYFSKALAAV